MYIQQWHLFSISSLTILILTKNDYEVPEKQIIQKVDMNVIRLYVPVDLYIS